MKKIIVLLVLCLWVLPAGSWAADLNPLSTRRAETLGQGNLRTDFSFTVDDMDDGTRLYQLPGKNFLFGVSDITDLILYFGFNMREGPYFDDEWGAGDLIVGLRAVPLTGPWGSLGFYLGTKLPNAENKNGLGTDVQDFYLMGLYTYSTEKFKLNLNAGLNVIGDNTRTRHYHYLFAYGVGAEYLFTDDWSIVADITGTTGSDAANEIHEASLGIVGPLPGGFEWAITGSVGLSRNAPDWSAGLFISRMWGVPGLISSGTLIADEDPIKINYYPFPMDTKEAWTVREKSLWTAYSFMAQGFSDDHLLYDVFNLGLRLGLARGVDVGIEFPYVVVADSPLLGDTDSSGGLILNFKISPWSVGNFRFGISNEVKLPTEDFSKGTGTGEMDYTFLFLTSASFGRFSAHLNAGLAIDGDPLKESSQNDYFVMGLGAEYALTSWASVFGEFYSKIGDDDDLSTYTAGGGFRFLLGKFSIDVSGGSGFGTPDPDWSVGFGISRLWDL